MLSHRLDKLSIIIIYHVVNVIIHIIRQHFIIFDYKYLVITINLKYNIIEKRFYNLVLVCSFSFDLCKSFIVFKMYLKTILFWAFIVFNSLAESAREERPKVKT